MADRTGFVIPNAGDYVGNQFFRIAEPDAQDFRTLGDDRYGVLSGCLAVATSGTTITVSTGGDPRNAVLVNGQAWLLPDTIAVPFRGGDERDRFDLIVFDAADSVVRLSVGTPAVDPVFPALSDTETLLWAVFVPAGATTVSGTLLTDKRKMLPRGQVTALDDTAPIVTNVGADGNDTYRVTADGRTTWKDVSIFRRIARVLRLDGAFEVSQNLTVDGQAAVGGDASVTGLIRAENLVSGFGPPSTSTPGGPGTFYQQFDGGGRAWLRKQTSDGLVWAEIGTNIASDEASSGLPPGTIVPSLLPIGHSFLTGFLPLSGMLYPPSACGALWTLAQNGVQPFASWVVTDGGSQVGLRLPDMTAAVPLQSTTVNVGTVAGSMAKTITEAQMPRHRHFSGGQTSPAGGHAHSVTVGSAGQHSHAVTGGTHEHGVRDPGHVHGPDLYAGRLIAQVWGGPYSLGGPISDSSHPTRVGDINSTARSATGLTVTTERSGHTHTVQATGAHTHPASSGQVDHHTHALPTENQVGGDQPFDVTPRHLSVRYYIKV